jgi:hypothetical protein
MSPQQAMMSDILSPHTPSPLPADADATVTGCPSHRRRSAQAQVCRPMAARLPATWQPDPGLHRDSRRARWCLHRHPAPRAKFDIGALPRTENQVPGGGLCRLRRISTFRSTRQDAQINCLSTLSIFMKQTTYLATLPNPKTEVTTR